MIDWPDQGWWASLTKNVILTPDVDKLSGWCYCLQRWGILEQQVLRVGDMMSETCAGCPQEEMWYWAGPWTWKRSLGKRCRFDTCHWVDKMVQRICREWEEKILFNLGIKQYFDYEKKNAHRTKCFYLSCYINKMWLRNHVCPRTPLRTCLCVYTPLYVQSF